MASDGLTDAERIAAIHERMTARALADGRRSPAARAEADEEGQRRKAAGAPPEDWVARYGFGAEDDVFGRGL